MAITRTSGTAHHTSRNGFALLIAVIFMAVMLALALMIGTLGYKQTILTSTALESQDAFYAADAALECALYADQQQQPNNPFLGFLSELRCDGQDPYTSSFSVYNGGALRVSQARLVIGSSACADITVYKYSEPQPPDNVVTYLFSQGYNVSCDVVESSGSARYASRGLQAHY